MRHAKSHAFTDGLSRRAQQDVTPETDPFEVILDGELSLAWTPERVGARLVEAFETLLALNLGVGPRGHANAWPAMLQEFADLVDAEAMANARDAFARARARPDALRIARMDEALAWPLRYGAAQPILCDAALVWAMGKARRGSIAGLLRARADRARNRARTMTRAENERRAGELRQATGEILGWAETMAEQRGLRDREGSSRAEGIARLRAAAAARHADAVNPLRPVKIAPHEATPGKVLSRASLDRHLPAALAMFAEALGKARIQVR